MSYPRPLADVVSALLSTEWARGVGPDGALQEDLCDLIAELDEALSEHHKREELDRRARVLLLGAMSGDPDWGIKRKLWMRDMGIEGVL